MPIRGVDEFVVRCTCGGFAVVRGGKVLCEKTGKPIDHDEGIVNLTEVRKPGEPFTPPRTWKPRS